MEGGEKSVLFDNHRHKKGCKDDVEGTQEQVKWNFQCSCLVIDKTSIPIR